RECEHRVEGETMVGATAVAGQEPAGGFDLAGEPIESRVGTTATADRTRRFLVAVEDGEAGQVEATTARGRMGIEDRPTEGVEIVAVTGDIDQADMADPVEIDDTRADRRLVAEGRQVE